jgi:RNase H-fold protein (predicted Holliday junction resolvase)
MELKKRIVALDIGIKRIGIATCDALWMSENPLKTINSNNDKIALDEIKIICQEYQIDIISVF